MRSYSEKSCNENGSSYYLIEILISYPLYVYSVVGLLDYIVVQFLKIIKETIYCFP